MHLGGRVLECLQQRALAAEHHDVGVVFEPRPADRLLLDRSTVNSTSIDVSTPVPTTSPSPCRACPSPRNSNAPGSLTGSVTFTPAFRPA